MKGFWSWHSYENKRNVLDAESKLDKIKFAMIEKNMALSDVFPGNLKFNNNNVFAVHFWCHCGDLWSATVLWQIGHEKESDNL